MKALSYILLMVIFTMGMYSCAHVEATTEEVAEIAAEEVAKVPKRVVNKVKKKIEVELADHIKPGAGYTYNHWTVESGDCLWDIAAHKNVYGDPFLWPLVYKANRDQISNPDIIQVGQRLDFMEGHGEAAEMRAREAAYNYKE